MIIGSAVELEKQGTLGVSRDELTVGVGEFSRGGRNLFGEEQFDMGGVGTSWEDAKDEACTSISV